MGAWVCHAFNERGYSTLMFMVTVAILAQGTSWAVAVTQAYFYVRRILFEFPSAASLCCGSSSDLVRMFWPIVCVLALPCGLRCQVPHTRLSFQPYRGSTSVPRVYVLAPSLLSS